MNFLAEVLSSAEKVELQEVVEKIPILKLKIEDVKTQIVEFMENVYLNFSERPRHNRKLVNDVKTMEEEINLLKHNIEIISNKQLVEASTNVEKYIISLNTINLTLAIVSQVCDLNEQLLNFDDLVQNNEYFSAMKLISEIESLPSQIIESEHLAFTEEIQNEIAMKKSTLLDKLSNVFSDNIVVTCLNDSQVILKIKKDTAELQEALQALYFNYTVISLLSSFASSLWQYFITPAVDDTIQLVEKEDNNFHILQITIDTSKSKSKYPLVFSNLKAILQFLKAHLDFKLGENLSLMKLIGDDIRDNLAELVIKHCLEDTIPSSTEDLQNYKTVIQETEKFEKTLQSYDIFAEDSTSLMGYTNNIDIHFIDKKCKEYSLACDVIMKKDLHDIKAVGVPYDPKNALETQHNELAQCSVSKSAIELMNYLEEIMMQAMSASELCAGRLLYTVKNIVIKYGHFVPEYHSKLLQTIPQQVALFHNNCFYISYELMKWKEKFSSEPSVKLVQYSFTVEAHQIQQIGMDCFRNYISKTKDSLIIIGIEGPMLETLSPDTEKSIRQCMRQQELLKTVWHKILSYLMYNKNIGTILDFMCSNLINSVVVIEDISSKAAEQLVEVFKIVINRGPKLFTDPKEINLFVPSWYKFNELNFVLAARLIDINDRWADGKGPLALQFKAIEMKSLIRALFQNTDRRAAVLSRIQD